MRSIEQLLHIPAEIRVYNADKLPVYLRAAYDFSVMRVAGVDCLLAQPKESVQLVALRKQRLQLEKTTGLKCVWHFVKTSPYIRQKMTEEGIPFIIENKAVYLPFLGIVLSDEKERTLPQVREIAFSTQKLLLTALYERWNGVNVSDAARKLNVSKMTASRIFDQIQSLDLPLIQETGKERCFMWDGSLKTLFEWIMPFLRYPVLREYRLDERVPHNRYRLGGMSAFSQYSMLNDNDYPTYAITKQQEMALDPGKFSQVPENEQPQTLLQVMQYEVRHPDDKAIDPITAYLTLAETEKQDPRVEMAFSEILTRQNCQNS